MTHASAKAEQILRRFARDTNLGIAGRHFIVTATETRKAEADALRTLLSRLGALAVGGLSAETVTVSLGDSDEIRLGTELFEGRGDANGRLDFATRHMPVTAAIGEELAASNVVRGLRIGIAMMLEPKTANLAMTLAAAGADVAVYAHPDETDDDVARALRGRGIPVDADTALSGARERSAALAFVERGFDVVIDDGSHLIRLAHESAPQLVRQWIGAAEETTSGLTPLRLMEREGSLATPVIAVNDAATKTMFDNRYGTGQSCVFAIADVLDAVGIAVRDQTALVIGYGAVGQGVAAHLAALGAEVSVAESDQLRALLASHDGFAVGTAEALATGSLVVSATGRAGTVTATVLESARIAAVAGGVPNEIDLSRAMLTAVTPHIDATATGTLVLDKGGCINITAAEGNPIEIMDLSFATQLAAVSHLVTTGPGIGVHALPYPVVRHVAAVAAAARGLELEPSAHGDDAPGWHSTRYTRSDT